MRPTELNQDPKHEYDINDPFQAHIYHVDRSLAFPNYFKVRTAPREGSFRWEEQKLKVVRA